MTASILHQLVEDGRLRHDVTTIRPGDKALLRDGAVAEILAVDLYRLPNGEPAVDRALLQFERTRGIVSRWMTAHALVVYVKHFYR